MTNTFGPKVIIGSWTGGFVITSSAPGSVIRGLSLVGFNGNPGGAPATANAITVAANNVRILDNNIGVNYDGICIEANTGVGVLLSGASNATVTGNIIAGNGIETQDLTTGDEVQINGISLSVPTPQNNLVENNLLGVNKDNTAPLINPGNGVVVQNGATGNTIRNNSIGRNAANGVWVKDNITSNAIIENNRIGVDGTGQFIAPNNTVDGDGVNIGTPFDPPALPAAVGNPKFNVVTNNVIAGNLGNGVSISSSDVQAQSNVVTANKIGVNATASVQMPNGGFTPAPNQSAGVLLTGSANGNTIGGSQGANANIISGNAGYGLRIGGLIPSVNPAGPSNPNNNSVRGNKIGSNGLGTGAPFDPAAPSDPLPKSNKGGAILFDAASFANTIANNEIAFNADNMTIGPPTSGITHVSTGSFNQWTQNSIFLNPPDTAPITPQINVLGGNEGLRNTQINNTAVTSLLKIDSAITIAANGQTTMKGTANFNDNIGPGVSNINNARIEIFVSRRGNQDTVPPSAIALQQPEGQLFLNSLISFQPNQDDPDTLDWSASLVIPAPFLQTPVVFLTATITTGDNSSSPFSIGRVPANPESGGWRRMRGRRRSGCRQHHVGANRTGHKSNSRDPEHRHHGHHDYQRGADSGRSALGIRSGRWSNAADYVECG